MRYETLKNNRIIRHTYYYLSGVVKKKNYYANAKKALDRFGVSFADENKTKTVIADMAKMKTLYGFDFDEYLFYKFYEKDKKDRLAFVADWEHLGYTCKMNSHKNDDIFDNKWKTYNCFKKYYLRDVLLLNGEGARNDFAKFLENKERFIVKPLDASCGNGVQIINKSEYSDFEELWKYLNNRYAGGAIVEELIVQHPEMAKFHPASVNTVRVPTIRLDDETLVINPFMRMGQNGKNVDNGGAGGIICAVDAETGKLFAAADENGGRFEAHSYSGEKIIGFQIPHWEEAKQLVKELASVVPDNRYTGWDLALTTEGWKLVEANRRGQFIWQIASQKGFRSEINSILKRMGKKY